MEIKYLGTAAAEGWPGMFCRCSMCEQARKLGGKNIRTRSQAVIDNRILVDFPPDTYLHVLRDGLDMTGIHTLIVTHSHQDHWYPQELAFRMEPFSHDMDGTIHVYGNDACTEELHRAELEMGEGAAAAMKVCYHEVEPFRPFEAEGYRITALLALHKRTERCYIYIVEKDGKSLLYANDTGIFPEATWQYIRGHHFDLVSMDCTMQKVPDGDNHMGLEDNVRLCRRLKEYGCTDENTEFVVTHFSHNGGLLHEELERRASEYGFLAAYDGMKVVF